MGVRSGFEYISDKQFHTAAKRCPRLLKKRFSLHTRRHLCALLIFQSNVDIRKVALWLAYASTQTTKIYLRADTATLMDMHASATNKGHFRHPDQLIALSMADG